MAYATVIAPEGHPWNGMRVHIAEQSAWHVATTVGTFARRDGVWCLPHERTIRLTDVPELPAPEGVPVARRAGRP